MTSGFLIKKLTSRQLQKVQRDLYFIDRITKAAKRLSCRVIISSGYAVDGNIGEVTRYHNDIDIQIYGKNKDATATMKSLLDEVGKQDKFFTDVVLQDKGREEYYHAFRLEKEDFIADLYYLQVTSDPFGQKKVIVKRDGVHSDPHMFETAIMSVNDVSFEGQQAQVELEDKRHKRNIRHDPVHQKHDQDMNNLEILLREECFQCDDV